MTVETAESAPVAAQPAEILAEVTRMLVDVVGDELLVAGAVARDSSFNEDLAIESIEFVALAERLEGRYGARVDFMAFLAELEMDEILAMTVGTLVDYIAAQLDGVAAESVPAAGAAGGGREGVV